MSQKHKSTPKPSPKNTLFNYFSKNNQTQKSGEVNKVGVEKENRSSLTGKQLDFGKFDKNDKW